MSSFREDEWVLCFVGGPHNTTVEIIRVAENVWDGKEDALCHMGSFTTRYSTKYLHKMPSSMRKLIPKDPDGKRLTTI